VAASVASSGIPDLKGMPNTAAGFAHAVLVLRNHYAPRVIVGYDRSIWGTGKDIHDSHPSVPEVNPMAAESVAFYRSLHTHTPYHYQDNHVQTLLSGSPASRRPLASYLRAGVVALLFGSGQPTDTCACDAAHDGVTNPAPIDGNRRRSVSADDDGGYFRLQARAYYRHPLPLS